MKVLIAPAHYLFSDKHGSEPLWSTLLVNSISDHVEIIDVIVGVSDLNTRPHKANVISLFSKKSDNLTIEFIRRSVFYVLVTFKALSLGLGKYDVVHHMLPLSFATVNPLILVCKIFYPRIKVVIGPAQAPYGNFVKDDFDLVLIGKKTSGPIKNLLMLIYFLVMPITKIVSKYFWNQADRVICISQMSKDYYSKFVAKHKIDIVPIGVSSPHKFTTKTNKVPVILYVGALISRKGVSYLLEAVNLLSKQGQKFKLIIVGAGAESDQLKHFVSNNKLDKIVEFKGQVSNSDIWKYYQISDILCIPSVEDSFPTVILEALSYGLPVIGADIGSIKEMIGEAGQTFVAKDSLSLSKTIMDVAKKDLLPHYKAKAIKRSQQFQLTTVSKKYFKIYSR